MNPYWYKQMSKEINMKGVANIPCRKVPNNSCGYSVLMEIE
jgi:hypothetical protein